MSNNILDARKVEYVQISDPLRTQPPPAYESPGVSVEIQTNGSHISVRPEQEIRNRLREKYRRFKNRIRSTSKLTSVGLFGISNFKSVTPREQFLRLAPLLQEVWYLYQELTWTRPIEAAGWSGLRKFCFVEGIHHISNSDTPRVACCQYVPVCRENLNSILCFLNCRVAVATLHELTGWWLTGISLTVEEVYSTLRQTPMSVTKRDPDGGLTNNFNYFHCFWRVELNDGKKSAYALDLSGAQYGWHTPAVPWEECVRDRCYEESVSTKKSGMACAEIKYERGSVQAEIIDHWELNVLEFFNNNMATIHSTRTAADILKLPEKEFLEAKRKYLSLARVGVLKAIRAADRVFVAERLELYGR